MEQPVEQGTTQPSFDRLAGPDPGSQFDAQKSNPGHGMWYGEREISVCRIKSNRK